MDGEASHGHGFVVGFPLRVFFGDAFEDATGVLDFGVVVEQEDFSDGHGLRLRFEELNGYNTGGGVL